MREVLLTSSVLILALLLLRRMFREKISRRVQYALWGLVLVRLLVPVSLPALDFSVLTMAEPVQETISARLEAPAFTGPVIPTPNLPQQTHNSSPRAEEPSIPGTKFVETQGRNPAVKTETSSAKEWTLTEILGLVWLAGGVGMTLWLLASNLGFAAKLRSRRISMDIPGCKYQVYMVESGLASPCLFGVLRPAIYLTPSAAASEESLRHVLAHEATHARHLDPLWALLRGVCLAMYWFNPLVWIAASAAKTDCELACDEGTLRRLGEGERLAYGRTLLSLVPVRRLPGNPLLSATTMSTDKKRLRDRITRIAENRKTKKLALCAMTLLTAGACVFTFAGCAERTGQGDNPDAVRTPTPIDSSVERQDGPLTGTELRFFNERFFNGSYMNIRNQFLSSTYEDPADIDLFELFYCGTQQGSSATEEERAAYEAANGFVDCDITKISTAEADTVLLENTGLTLAEANKASLEEGFTYLPEFDAYFNGHGDTNYRGQVDITAGEREGDLIRLYYNDTFYADGWKRVTLRETEDGGYWFVSNAACEKPVIATVYPEGEPLLTIPLADLAGSEPRALEMVHHSGDCEERFTGYGQNWNVWGHHVQGYRSTDGIIYLAEVTEAQVVSGEGMVTWEADCFMVMPNDEFRIELCSDLFGRNGFLVYATDHEISGTSFLWYKAFDDDGTLLNLVTYQSQGNIDAQVIDLDGDGVNELLCRSGSDARLFFQRDGKICEADIPARLLEALPEDDIYIEFGEIVPYARCLPLWYFTKAVGDSGVEFEAAAFRNVYFDGKNLLVYKLDKTAADHIAPGVSGPEYVMDAIREQVQAEQSAYQQGDVDFVIGDADYDDWRIVSLSGPWYETFYEGDSPMTVEIFRFSYEFHAAAPEKVVLAGGMYIDEDGWFCPGYPDCDYLYFRQETDSSRTYLFRMMENDCGPGDELFREDLERALLQKDAFRPSPVQTVQTMLDEVMTQYDMLTITLSCPIDAERATSNTYTYPTDSDSARSLYRYLTDPETFAWTGWDGIGGTPDGIELAESVSLISTATQEYLIFYSGSEYVQYSKGGLVRYYRVKNLSDPADAFADYADAFHSVRRIYDEAERSTLAGRVLIPDTGVLSRDEIARAWAEAYEGTAMELTGTSRYHCSYVDVRDVKLNTDIARENYPESIGDRDALLVEYSVVFVPDDYRYYMAGNTVEYEGDDAPEGAYQYWRVAYLYHDDLKGGWRSDSVGTGF